MGLPSLYQAEPPAADFYKVSRYSSVTSATPKPPKEDLRVLIALDTDEGRGGTPRREPFEVRSLICKEFNLRLADVPDVRPTPTGYAVRTASPAVRDGLLSPEPLQKLQSLLGAARVGRPEKWFNYAVPEVPWTFRGLLAPGEIVNTADHIVEEVEAQTGKLPAHYACEHHAANTAGKKLKAIRRAGGRRYDEANKPRETPPTDEMEITVATTAPPATVTRKRAHSTTSTNTGSSPSHTPSETGAPTASAPLPQRTGERPGRRQAASQGTYNEQQLFNETRYGLLNDNAPAPNSHA
ncbi:hypothetical protein F5883DRAFT_653626 [Diaporthe sp. PMI_573]|nr:hypothetical protein F5883DRAFT_670147 [Diaporthaceae sp. PMI_573]KAH8747297.1 hypothetical protein F5883DRAFT_653626 [Diaporthaceae sp. PMI_573]